MPLVSARVRVAAVALGATALALAVPAAAPGAGAVTRPTMLRIAYYEDGREPETLVIWTLRCNPVGGNHPRRSAACRELARLGTSTLRPVPPRTACAEIYGGPQVAVVSGLVAGRRVWVRLRRDNGCEIDRWQRSWFLVPATGVR
jgi:hypothetical protein